MFIINNLIYNVYYHRSVTVDTMHIKDHSFTDCNMVLFLADECRLSNRNKTLDMSVKSMMVIISIHAVL